MKGKMLDILLEYSVQSFRLLIDIIWRLVFYWSNRTQLLKNINFRTVYIRDFSESIKMMSELCLENLASWRKDSILCKKHKPTKGNHQTLKKFHFIVFTFCCKTSSSIHSYELWQQTALSCTLGLVWICTACIFVRFLHNSKADKLAQSWNERLAFSNKD